MISYRQCHLSYKKQVIKAVVTSKSSSRSVGLAILCAQYVYGENLNASDGVIAFLLEEPGFLIARMKPVFPVDSLTHCCFRCLAGWGQMK